jgi:large conductance mechanosensitive channel
MLKEFRDFIMKGNVLDLAVAVIIGTAFSAIVNSLVKDIFIPLIGIIIGGIDFTGLKAQVGSATLTYGNFIQALVNFLLIGFSIFMFIKAIKTAEDKLAGKNEEKPTEPPAPPEEVLLLREIRDSLKK